MKPEEVIRKNHTRNFLLFLLLLLLAGTAASAAVLYLDIYRPLNTHYSAVLTIMTGVKDTLIMKSLKINALSFVLIAAGVGVLTLLYTHRIAGPLHRIKIYAKSVSSGKLNGELTFRRKDAVNTFAEALNDMTKNYGNSISQLAAEVDKLKTSVTELKEHGSASEDRRQPAREISAIDGAIKRILGDIKL